VVPIDEVTLDAAQIAERWFDPDSGNLAGARQFVRDVAPDDVTSEGDLLLSVSELVTNALLHGRSGFGVRVTTGSEAVRVEVFDASPLLPAAKNYGPAAITGRGLRIVDHLSSSWGVTPVDGGKWVWFEMARAAAGADDRGPRVTVRLLGLPVPVHARAAAHHDALRREFDLLRQRVGPDEAPPRLLALVEELDRRYAGFDELPAADLAAAIDRDDPTVDLTFDVPADAAARLTHLGRLLDEADEYSLAGEALMTTASPPEIVAYRRWFIGQFVDQLVGAAPVPWPTWRAAHPDGPAPAAPAAAPPPADGEAVVRPAGDLDIAQGPAVHDELLALHNQGVAAVTLDLGEVTFLDSFGISVIVAAHTRFTEDGARLVVVVPPSLQPVFDMAGLGQVLDLRPPD